jgi:glycosyltransferase involved in cell wall biosynthesis
MRLLIATVQVPFVRGGAEAHSEGLQRALRRAGHEAEIVALPFKWYPAERILDHVLACRLFDLTESSGVPVDRVIGLKFPAYLVPHPNKVIWLLHQHRQAYDLWDHPEAGDLQYAPNGLDIREAIRRADIELIPESRHVFTNSRNVSARLERFCSIKSKPLYHPPPGADLLHGCAAEDYLLLPSRITAIKRQNLVLQALALTREPVQVRFVGSPDTPVYGEELKQLSSKLGVANRVQWLGSVSEEEKIRLYGSCVAVVFPPVDEDYGYVTLEAMLASKPVLTCTDSGGPNEFVIPGETGFSVDPNPDAMAVAMDRLWNDRALAARLGRAGRDRYADMRISWDNVVGHLTR